jgi:hypothetical protein
MNQYKPNNVKIVASAPNCLGKLFATYALYDKFPPHLKDSAGLSFDGMILEDYIECDNIVYVKIRSGMHNEGYTPYSSYRQLSEAEVEKFNLINEREK